MLGYSKTSFYKLECKDPKVTEIYVGSTTDFYTRKNCHKRCCINKDNKDKYNLPVYQYMRLHGGWENWNMLEIEVVNCRSKRHKNQLEAKYIKELGAKLNSVMPQDIDDGLGGNDYNKQWREKNKDKFEKKTKEYYEKNKGKMSEKGKEYRDKNREKLAEKKKEYCAKNAEKIAEKKKEWYDKNAEKIADKKKEWYDKNAEKIAEKVKCDCGTEVRRNNLPRHKRTQKHQEWVNRPEANLVFVD